MPGRRGTRRAPGRAAPGRGTAATRSVSAIAPADQAITSGRRRSRGTGAARAPARRRGRRPRPARPPARAAARTASRCCRDDRPLLRPPGRRERRRAPAATRARCRSSTSRTTASASARAASRTCGAAAAVAGAPRAAPAARRRAAPGTAACSSSSAARCSRSAAAYCGSRSSTSCQRAYRPRLSAAAAEQPVELGVVGLALLPAGGDRGDRARQLEQAADDRAPGWAAAADPRIATRVRSGHAACTCTVRPTSSSIPRSTS